jgi:hypothetical protein
MKNRFDVGMKLPLRLTDSQAERERLFTTQLRDPAIGTRPLDRGTQAADQIVPELVSPEVMGWVQHVSLTATFEKRTLLLCRHYLFGASTWARSGSVLIVPPQAQRTTFGHQLLP